MHDSLSSYCNDCAMKFTMYQRKHHCRMCGKIFCNQCSSHYIDGVRACRSCHDKISDAVFVMFFKSYACDKIENGFQTSCPEKVVGLMKKLLFSQDNADVVFELVPCGEKIFAHKCILAVASDPMKALVTGQWLENQNDSVCLVKVEHSALAMKAMLKFIYVGTIDITNLDDHHFELFDLAAQYDLPDLSTACETVCIKLL